MHFIFESYLRRSSAASNKHIWTFWLQDFTRNIQSLRDIYPELASSFSTLTYAEVQLYLEHKFILSISFSFLLFSLIFLLP